MSGNGDWALPRGRHKLPREVVVETQRARLLAGAARAMVAHGYVALTVEQIIEEARVSRTTFYENFENKRDCIRVAHEVAFDRLAGGIFRACAGALEWSAKVAAAVGVAIRFAASSPGEARLLTFDAVGAEPELAARVLASNDQLVAMLRAGREHCSQASVLPELTERAMIGAITSVVGSRILRGEAERLPELESQLVQLILIPYLGVDGAGQAATGLT